MFGRIWTHLFKVLQLLAKSDHVLLRQCSSDSSTAYWALFNLTRAFVQPLVLLLQSSWTSVCDLSHGADDVVQHIHAPRIVSSTVTALATWTSVVDHLRS